MWSPDQPILYSPDDLSGSGGEEQRFSPVVEAMRKALEQHPEVMVQLSAVPVLWEVGTATDVVDISVGTLLARLYGVDGEPESSYAIAGDLAKYPKSGARQSRAANLRTTGARLLEVVRQTFFADFPGCAKSVGGVEETYVRLWQERFHNFPEAAQALREGKVAALDKLPVFNSESPPDSVLNTIDEVIAGVSVESLRLMTVGDYFRAIFGLGVKRNLADWLARELGYGDESSSRGSSNRLTQGILVWLNRCQGTRFVVSDWEDPINTAERFQARLDLAETKLSVGDPQRRRATWAVERLAILGLSDAVIAREVNKRLLCVAQFGAKPLSAELVSQLIYRLGGKMKRGEKKRGLDRDEWEWAARWWHQFEAGEVVNERVRLALEVLEALQDQDQSLRSVARERRVRAEDLSQLVVGVRAELEMSTWADPLHALYARVQGEGRETVEWEQMDLGSQRRVTQRLYPLYLAYREQIAQEAGKKVLEVLSDWEKTIVLARARGETFEKIGDDLAVHTDVPAMHVAVLLSGSLERRGNSLKAVRQQYEKHFQTLSAMVESDDPRLYEFGLQPGDEKLKMMLRTMELLANGLTHQQVRVKLQIEFADSPENIANSKIIARRVAAIVDGEKVVYLAGDRSLFEGGE